MSPLKMFKNFFESKSENNQESVVGYERLKEIIFQLQKPLGKTAASAAKSSIKIASIVLSTDQAKKSLDEIFNSAHSLKESVDKIVTSSMQTSNSAREMKQIISDNTQISHSANKIANELQSQMNEMGAQFQDLIRKINAISQVSKVVEEIALQTKLLSFNASVEAQRAGAHGKGFAVVALEIRSLAENVSARNSDINNLISEVSSNLGPVKTLLDKGLKLATQTSEESQKVEDSMTKMMQLTENAVGSIDNISAIADMNKESLDAVISAVNNGNLQSQKMRDDVQSLSSETSGLTGLVEQSYSYFGEVDTGSDFNKFLKLAKEFGKDIEELFESKIDQGLLSLDDVKSFQYTEYKGEEINKLKDFFDVSRVSREGFNPPKYFTRYDRVIDKELQVISDRIKSSDPKLIFSILIDLNSYTPAHNSVYSKGWVGDYAQDLVGNRSKRFFFEARVLVRGARVGFHEKTDLLPNMATVRDFAKIGVDLNKKDDQKDEYLVQAYPRDTGAVLTALTIPVYIKGFRYGAVLMGWSD